MVVVHHLGGRPRRFHRREPREERGTRQRGGCRSHPIPGELIRRRQPGGAHPLLVVVRLALPVVEDLVVRVAPRVFFAFGLRGVHARPVRRTGVDGGLVVVVAHRQGATHPAVAVRATALSRVGLTAAIGVGMTFALPFVSRVHAEPGGRVASVRRTRISVAACMIVDASGRRGTRTVGRVTRLVRETSRRGEAADGRVARVYGTRVSVVAGFCEMGTVPGGAVA